MATVTINLQPPTLNEILYEVCRANHCQDTEWYIDNIHSHQPLVINIKRWMAFIASGYGYTKKQIGPYIGNDNGSSVTYYKQTISVWIEAYGEESDRFEEIIKNLVLKEKYTLTYEKGLSDNLPDQLKGLIIEGITYLPQVDLVIIQDIKNCIIRKLEDFYPVLRLSDEHYQDKYKLLGIVKN